MGSRREAMTERIMNAWRPPTGVNAMVGMRFRGPGTYLMAAMRTCCAVAMGELHSGRRLGREGCHAAWDDLAEYVMDRCDCPHDETPDGPLPAIDRLLSEARGSFLASTRERLPVPEGWDVQDMDQVRGEIDQIGHLED